MQIHCKYTRDMVKTKNRTIRVEDDIWEKAAAAAKANGENVSVVIRRALITYIRENQS